MEEVLQKRIDFYVVYFFKTNLLYTEVSLNSMFCSYRHKIVFKITACNMLNSDYKRECIAKAYQMKIYET